MPTPRSFIMAVLLILTASPLWAATNYQDWWWNPDQDGQGVNIGQQGNTLAASWFTYDQTGAGMFLILAGPVINNKVTGDLIRTVGPALGTPFNPDLVVETVVGTATLTFSDANNGVLQYTVNGISGSLAITRFSFAPLNPVGTYLGGATNINSGCTQSAHNGQFFHSAAYGITTNNNNLNIQEAIVGDGTCSYAGTYTQNGSRISASGLFSCTGGFGGTWSSKEILLLDDAFVMSNLNLKYTSGETCQVSGVISASKLQ
ncbi:MAG TPA: hypothetical protein VN418_04355 [Gammaproteobacteria bacterium]|nr:hypothetical protein [Gammaproteobacteria bacterium]